MTIKKICVPIVNRTNYSKLKPILTYLKNNSSIKIEIVASSALVVDRIGDAIKDIERDAFIIKQKIECLMMNDTLDAMVQSSGVSLIQHASFYANSRPDTLLVVGDRFDIFPAVWAAKVMNIPIFHLQGGERSGCVDDTVRDLISICADRHYVATQKAYDKVMSIAHVKNIFHVGCPAVEYIQSLSVGEYLDVSTFSKKYKKSFGIKPYEKYAVVVLHPNTTQDNDVDMSLLLECVLAGGMKCVVLYPNIDAFYNKILDSIRPYSSQLICVKHMPLSDYAKLMAHATYFIGNSSSGIRETASFGIPTINVGTRQENRERNKNTLDCNGDKDSINHAICWALTADKFQSENIYFKENCSKHICENILWK